MKTIIAAAAVAAFGTAASAAEIGYGLNLGGEAVAEYNVDAENMSVTFEPVLGYTVAPVGVTLEVSTLLSIYDDEFVEATFETLPTLDFRASKAIKGGLEAYGEISYDLEAKERGDAVIGVSFSF